MTVLNDDKKYVWHPFTDLKKGLDPINIKSGKGVFLTTETGDSIVDYISSWWVNIHGHCHPYIIDAVHRQAQILEQVIFAGFTHDLAIRVCKKLSQILPSSLSRTFFSDNGSTAVEVALKVAYQYHQNTNGKRSRILTFDGGYHGDTVGAMSASQSGVFRRPWNDLLFKTDVLPYPQTYIDNEDVRNKEEKCLIVLDNFLEKHGKHVCAIILEPLVQGASGMRMARPMFLRSVCDKVRSVGGLVIFDEVMTGFGRTGTMFAHDQICPPDILCLSKGLTAGFLPMAVTVFRENIYGVFSGQDVRKAFLHGHSFTANSLGCAAALASLELFDKESTFDHIKRIENTHKTVGFEMLSKCKHLKNTRVQGTIIAADVQGSDQGYTAEIARDLKAYFWQNGALIRPLGNTIYLLPPYVMDTDTLISGYKVINSALSELMG